MDGPTALRSELVQAMSFSRGTALIDTSDGKAPACAGLVGVWNGKKGFVAVLIRQLERARLQRWVYEDRLGDLRSVSTAIEAALAFASSLGFDMDAPRFSELDMRGQEERMEDWNDLRKLSRQPRAALESSRPPDTSTTPITADDHGGAVLGRLSLVRRRGYTSPLARLLSYF